MRSAPNHSFDMNSPLRVLVLALTLLAGGCISYEENQIRYTSADHQSGQIKEWHKPTVEIPLALPSFGEKENKTVAVAPLRRSDSDIIETTDGSSPASPTPQTSEHLKEALFLATSSTSTSAQ